MIQIRTNNRMEKSPNLERLSRSMRWLALLVAVASAWAILAITGVASGQNGSYVPPKGFVPDSLTAERIAEAVLVPVYGVEQIQREKPLTATLAKGVWTVSGTLPQGRVGGIAEVRIAKKDARILYMMHGK
jgi:hypothetical protein